jgi:hypothetical protein
MILSYMHHVEKTRSRLRWAQQQVSDAEKVLREVEQGSAQLATCLDFLLAATAAGRPVTYEEARTHGYVVHAAALASLLRDAETIGYARPLRDGRWEVLPAGNAVLFDLAYSLRHNVKKLK